MAYPAPQTVIDQHPQLDVDGLPMPTQAQVLYWVELCRAVHDQGKGGMQEKDWPAALVPSRATLKELTRRKLLVRRSKAWHLKRHWSYELAGLRVKAVPTPRLMIVERPAPNLPSYAELEAWEKVCLWLDMQAKRRSRLPFVGLADLPTERLHAMRKYHLVQHTRDCFWRLSPTWKDRLQALWQGVVAAVGERDPDVGPFLGDQQSVAFGLDTWYLNRIDEEGLPPWLRTQLDDLQAQAKEQDDEIETPWIFDGAPLLMYRSGVASKPGQPSWSYILRNNSLALRIRRSPLGGIIAQVQFSSECLWRLTPLEALNRLDAFFRKLWGVERGRWQVSQAHIAHDVMNTTIEAEQLNRYVSRSRTQAIMEAARKDIEPQLGYAQDDLPLSVDWESIYGVGDDPFYDPFLGVGTPIDLE